MEPVIRISDDIVDTYSDMSRAGYTRRWESGTLIERGVGSSKLIKASQMSKAIKDPKQAFMNNIEYEIEHNITPSLPPGFTLHNLVLLGKLLSHIPNITMLYNISPLYVYLAYNCMNITYGNILTFSKMRHRTITQLKNINTKTNLITHTVDLDSYIALISNLHKEYVFYDLFVFIASISDIPANINNLFSTCVNLILLIKGYKKAFTTYRDVDAVNSDMEEHYQLYQDADTLSTEEKVTGESFRLCHNVVKPTNKKMVINAVLSPDFPLRRNERFAKMYPTLDAQITIPNIHTELCSLEEMNNTLSIINNDVATLGIKLTLG